MSRSTPTVSKLLGRMDGSQRVLREKVENLGPKQIQS